MSTCPAHHGVPRTHGQAWTQLARCFSLCYNWGRQRNLGATSCMHRILQMLYCVQAVQAAGSRLSGQQSPPTQRRLGSQETGRVSSLDWRSGLQSPSQSMEHPSPRMTQSTGQPSKLCLHDNTEASPVVSPSILRLEFLSTCYVWQGTKGLQRSGQPSLRQGETPCVS